MNEKTDPDESGSSPPRPASALRQALRSGGQHSSANFRGDVAGLRAVAVGLVLLYHAGLPFLPGGFVGVDVFFVISGFLITGQLRRRDRPHRPHLAGRLLRPAGQADPARRDASSCWPPPLRPGSSSPGPDGEEIGGDIVSAATYVVNWRLADRAVDYLAQDSLPSPVQHFWSLAVEEQFYLVWPLLIIAAICCREGRPDERAADPVARARCSWRCRRSPGRSWRPRTSPERAFFVSTTRMWELAIGAGIALVRLAWHGCLAQSAIAHRLARPRGHRGVGACSSPRVRRGPGMPRRCPRSAPPR